MGLFDDFNAWAGKGKSSPPPKGKDQPKLTQSPAGPGLPGPVVPPPEKKVDAWAMWAPPSKGVVKAQTPQAPPEKENPWAMWAPGGKVVQAPEKTGGFTVFAPAEKPVPIQQPLSEPSPFAAWAPGAPGPTSLREALVPEGEQGSRFAPPQELFQPEPVRQAKPKPQKEEADDYVNEDLVRAVEAERQVLRKDVKKAQKAKKKWVPPTTQDMVKILKEAFDLDELWSTVRGVRSDEFFASQLEEGQDEFGGEGARYELHTVADGSYGKGTFVEQMFDFFGIPVVEIDRYLKAWEAEEFDMGEGGEAIMEDVYYPLINSVETAFDTLKPKDIPGHFQILDYHEGLVNIAYTESEGDLTPEEFKKLTSEIKKGKSKARAKDKEEREKEELDLKKFLGSWRVPSAGEMQRKFEGVYDLDDLFAQIRNAKKSQVWRDEAAETGQGTFVIEGFGSEADPENVVHLARFLDIPEDLIERSYKEDDDHVRLWDDVIQPTDDAITAAFERMLPDDLDGFVSIYVDGNNEFALGYSEYGG